MTGNFDFILIQDRYNKNIRFLTRERYIVKGAYNIHYKRIILLGGETYKGTLIKDFFNGCSRDTYMGCIPTDMLIKVDISAYMEMSSILKKLGYKFNKKTQQIVNN